MKVKEEKHIEVTVDKRHIVSLGERLYTESIELLRELVNNAYDADASVVRITIASDRIVVEDDGSGLDFDGLKQYFNIGSEEKVFHPRTPKYGRDRIGQFGIGKFASLAAASCFEVFTQQNDFAARVIFDKIEWEKSKDTWHIPCNIISPDIKRGNGTTVVLSRLTKSFELKEVEKRLSEAVPLKAPDFMVYVNGRRLLPRSFVGYRIPLLEGSKYGIVSGEIVITPSSMASTKDLGIDIKVKGVTVKRDFFGMETWGKVVARIKGEINADFLPITSDRSNFVTDSDQYREFFKIMEKTIGNIKKILGREADRRYDRRAGQAVKDALRRIHKALAINPDLSPFGPIPYGEEKGIGGGAVLGQDKVNKDIEIKPEESDSAVRPKPRKKRKSNPLVKKITPNAIVRRMKMGDSTVSVCLDFFGETGPECFSEGNIIYINRDHPLFKRESKRSATYTMYVARLMTQEISLMNETRSPRLAFKRQNKLLKDAFAED